ncbi:hypothetical protein OsI_23886 [Oryza sativa Indica Group]|uniref:Uncharacterized protein n=1 Tax=Oryza sativa subsp. indica TaxID=39946 RepID=A2YFK3_ORYSI|nr:hypothetical protein OsI_23886 [Oryza sativa Indica Group]
MVWDRARLSLAASACSWRPSRRAERKAAVGGRNRVSERWRRTNKECEAASRWWVHVAGAEEAASESMAAAAAATRSIGMARSTATCNSPELDKIGAAGGGSGQRNGGAAWWRRSAGMAWRELRRWRWWEIGAVVTTSSVEPVRKAAAESHHGLGQPHPQPDGGALCRPLLRRWARATARPPMPTTATFPDNDELRLS